MSVANRGPAGYRLLMLVVVYSSGQIQGGSNSTGLDTGAGQTIDRPMVMSAGLQNTSCDFSMNKLRAVKGDKLACGMLACCKHPFPKPEVADIGVQRLVAAGWRRGAAGTNPTLPMRRPEDSRRVNAFRLLQL